MLNNTLFAATFRQLPNISIKNADLKCFSTLRQCAVAYPRSRNGDFSRKNVKEKMSCAELNMMVSIFLKLHFQDD